MAMPYVNYWMRAYEDSQDLGKDQSTKKWPLNMQMHMQINMWIQISFSLNNGINLAFYSLQLTKGIIKNDAQKHI